MSTILSFLFVLGVLVFVHELGHFLVARWYGVRVITFSLGFGPKLVKVQRGATEYCISAVPLGGYVKLAGETVEDPQSGAPDEFMSKSKWVRFQVYLAGPAMNILLAVAVSAVVLSGGADVPLYKSEPPAVGVVAAGSPAEGAGFRVGDLIVSIDGRDVATWDDVDLAVLPSAGSELAVEVMRGGERIRALVVPDAYGDYEHGDIGVQPVLRPQITQVNPGSPAEDGGLRRGDVVVAVNGEPALLGEETIDLIHNSPDTPIVLTVEREGARADVTVVPEGQPGAALIGVSISPWEVRRVDPTFAQAVEMSLQQKSAGVRCSG
jgi:regulator of sigma E protease